MSAVEALPAARSRRLLRGAGARRPARAASCSALIAVCLLFAFPVFWLVLTSLRPGYARLLRPPRHRLHARQLPRGARPGDRAEGAVEQLRHLDAGDRALARRDRDIGLHAVALQGTHPDRLVRRHLRVPLRALRLLGAAALFRHAGDGHLRHLLGPAAAARGGAHLLLLLDHEGLLRRHRPVDGICRHDRRLLALGRVPARRPAGGDTRPHRARHPVLALHLERVPVRAHPDRQQHADADRRDGAVRARARHGVASDERHRACWRSDRR